MLDGLDWDPGTRPAVLVRTSVAADRLPRRAAVAGVGDLLVAGLSWAAVRTEPRPSWTD
ncbi:hypothetical protein [Streptomyces violaceus]|uniref:Uncharacterized protein n=1 Tax=Streptomyces violaceus TaxID=1936 RepID=A0ABY9U2Y1_STRVL|nr:hypothetical protein [Streptomyces janthinus]WND17110.1 hypothetical protein RI060_06980 [Streptomyces janthinus]